MTLQLDAVIMVSGGFRRIPMLCTGIPPTSRAWGHPVSVSAFSRATHVLLPPMHTQPMTAIRHAASPATARPLTHRPPHRPPPPPEQVCTGTTCVPVPCVMRMSAR